MQSQTMMLKTLLYHKLTRFRIFASKKEFLNNKSCTIRNQLFFTEIEDSDVGNILWKFKLDLYIFSESVDVLNLIIQINTWN